MLFIGDQKAALGLLFYLESFVIISLERKILWLTKICPKAIKCAAHVTMSTARPMEHATAVAQLSNSLRKENRPEEPGRF